MGCGTSIEAAEGRKSSFRSDSKRRQSNKSTSTVEPVLGYSPQPTTEDFVSDTSRNSILIKQVSGDESLPHLIDSGTAAPKPNPSPQQLRQDAASEVRAAAAASSEPKKPVKSQKRTAMPELWLPSKPEVEDRHHRYIKTHAFILSEAQEPGSPFRWDCNPATPPVTTFPLPLVEAEGGRPPAFDASWSMTTFQRSGTRPHLYECDGLSPASNNADQSASPASLQRIIITDGSSISQRPELKPLDVPPPGYFTHTSESDDQEQSCEAIDFLQSRPLSMTGPSTARDGSPSREALIFKHSARDSPEFSAAAKEPTKEWTREIARNSSEVTLPHQIQS